MTVPKNKKKPMFTKLWAAGPGMAGPGIAIVWKTLGLLGLLGQFHVFHKKHWNNWDSTAFLLDFVRNHMFYLRFLLVLSILLEFTKQNKWFLAKSKQPALGWFGSRNVCFPIGSLTYQVNASTSCIFLQMLISKTVDFSETK